MVRCVREPLVRLWLDVDVSISLVSLLSVVSGASCCKAEALNTNSCLGIAVQSEHSTKGKGVMQFQLGI